MSKYFSDKKNKVKNVNNTVKQALESTPTSRIKKSVSMTTTNYIQLQLMTSNKKKTTL